ncbi:MAG: indole-3-glycerol phosphate synthase TrpC [Dehalococcoidia bacterium]|nr:indole-3-glycerol phosphate synthase TrpC [Dehalococcoidia bacterium]
MVEQSAARVTGTILDRIVASRRLRLAEDRALRDEAALRTMIEGARPPISFAARLREGRVASPASRLRLVAEIKRASPSKGVFDADLDAVAQARDYAEAGAAAISILTEPDYFSGGIADLAGVCASFDGDADRPALLRKDFIFDAYQVLEARAFGADALLLIVMLLEPDGLRDLLAQTRALGMEALVEVHDEDELRTAVEAGATVIGVNNRDLRTFHEDLGTFERLSALAEALAPEGVTLVAESAIRAPEDAVRMAEAGAHALLVGEALVRSGTVVETARSLMLAEAPQ